ncbi:aspartate kinase [Chengkuizengella sp. SCS-71B]|uniref:aspartate kinase n=1 Tax=Chengkuizengella sp. SCS-71B TaxID=3115290 RepID=UPI0032C23705
MSLVVMKFGGSSVGSAERIKKVAERIIEKKREGHQCVVVVSAMGDTTDELVDLCNQLTDHPPAREMDMLLSTGEQVSMSLLSMSIQHMGYRAISLTGWQSGMTTDCNHGNAKIVNIKPNRIYKALEEEKIVIIAGFQGLSEEGEISTLGRGGSDTTAVALAAAINADLCEIYTDVDGVYSTDPRIVRVAQKLDEISYEEMLELAQLGAAVLHPRAVEYAKNYNVPLVVRSSFSHREGTLVMEGNAVEKSMVVRGIAYDKNVARISVLEVEDIPGILATVFGALADAGIDVDIIVQSGVRNGAADFSFSIANTDVEKAMVVMEELRSTVTFREVTYETDLVKVSIVGAGMVSNPGVAAKMFRVISQQEVSIKLVSTSEIKTSCVIDRDKLTEVILALHTAYGLDANQQAFVGGPKERR